MQAKDKAEWRRRFQDCIRQRGLRLTQQRMTIANVFLSATGHLNIDELYRKVRARDPHVGYATIYRTLRLLRDCGLAAERNFEDGAARFEPVGPIQQQQHYHLICRECGRIVEFENESLSAIVATGARCHGFHADSHKLEIYGRCAVCLPATEH
jgi:Fur family transcriptional regulator, ferric uptake regulator